ncbi:MAG: helix-turn-helix transcriptional regulator [Lachnospiraceae bacterium]|nr:helix-turn-helix transcriptional regulator [Lachnospiraceae bacterium]
MENRGGGYLLSKMSLDMIENDYHIIKYSEGENSSYFMHYHDFYEVIIYMGEDMTYLLEEKEYPIRGGDVILCRMFENHMLLCRENEGHQRISLGIDPKILGQLSTREANLFQIFSKKNPGYPILHLEMEAFYDYLKIAEHFQRLQACTGPEKKILERGLVIQALGFLFRDSLRGRQLGQSDDGHIQKVSEILEFVEKNLEQELPLEHIAREFNYSVSHICRLFREVTGNTLTSYIIEKRISLARQLLYGNAPIVEIAQKCGFRNYSNFYKMFRKSMGIGPEEYRNQKIGNINNKI